MRLRSHRNCSCLGCQERLWSDEPGVPKRTPAPDGETHFDVHGPMGRSIRGRCRVTIDGRDVTDSVFEAVTGEHGWVAVYSENTRDQRHLCAQCNRAACAHVERGRVALEVFADASA